MMINLSQLPEDQISAVHDLQGRTLATGWRVLEKAKSTPASTGGNFSVCYIVEKDGKLGFLKAINILTFIRDNQDMMAAVVKMMNTYEFEKELLSRCSDKSFSKVSKLLEASFENFPGYLVANVYYMIFEKADGDVRNHLHFSGQFDDAWKLRSLHNIAVGIKQLHSIEISHQDVKPSNIFVFDKMTSKLGDLGRSLCQTLDSPHGKLDFSGDVRYAPPEVYHKYALPDWKDKVFAIDCYLLGSMACFYFTGQSMTALLATNLDKNINIWTLKFANALDYWVAAFDKAIEILEEHTSTISDQHLFIDSIRMLCHPDPAKRGHIKTRQERGNDYQLTRFVEVFNLLARKAEYKLKKAHGQ